MNQGEQYYRGFFWMAGVSFLVPLVVAWAAFRDIAPTTKPTPQPDASGVDHAVWDYLLKSYVRDGLIDYTGMKKDYLFREYLRELGTCQPDQLPDDASRLALACNAYNAFVINGVITHRIDDTVDGFTSGGTGFFDLQEHIFAGETLSLNDLEHGRIRPEFQEPRIHVALVCAAKSCPVIRAEAYVGERLDRQLEDQSRQFANQRKYVDFDADSQELRLSPILNWYGDDWNQRYPDGGYLEWIEGLAKDPTIVAGIQQARAGEANIAFFSYDWSLNSQQPASGKHTAAKSGGGFGSGSSPDE